MTASIEHTRGQMVLDVRPLQTPDVVTGITIQERFESFHDLNPWVLEALETLTRYYLDSGHSRVGIGMLFEVLRWQYGIATTGEEFKLNNNMRSRYVRLMLLRNPSWEEVFHTRALKSA